MQTFHLGIYYLAVQHRLGSSALGTFTWLADEGIVDRQVDRLPVNDGRHQATIPKYHPGPGLVSRTNKYRG